MANKIMLDFDKMRGSEFTRMDEGFHIATIKEIKADFRNDKDLNDVILQFDDGLMKDTLYKTEKAMYRYVELVEAVNGSRASGAKDFDLDKLIGKKVGVEIVHKYGEKLIKDQFGDVTGKEQTGPFANVKKYVTVEKAQTEILKLSNDIDLPFEN